MNENLSTIASIIGGLLVVLFLLPILVGGIGSSLFWLLLGFLLLALAASVYYTITNQHPQHYMYGQAEAEGLNLGDILQRAIDALPDEATQSSLPQLPPHATLVDYQALPPGYLAQLLSILAREQRKRLAGVRFTSRLEMYQGVLFLYLRQEHLIAQLAAPSQPKIILDGTASPSLLQALFPNTPITVEQPAIINNAQVVQVIGQDWAKTTLHGARRERWFDEVASHIHPNRPTLVVTTLDCEEDLRQALIKRGHSATLVKVGHYGGLRGSNAYKGYDLLLAQVYHLNREEIIRTARALFADDATPLDERMLLVPSNLTDTSGASWEIQVPSFADPRLAALLHSRREAEIAQAALRGRPWEHAEAQITILSSLPLPGLAPTTIRVAQARPSSNDDRTRVAQARLLDAARELLGTGKRVLDAPMLARQAGVSVATVRKHWATLARRLHLRPLKLRSRQPMPRGGQREHIRAVLVRHGRTVAPGQQKERQAQPSIPATSASMIDHAHNKTLDTGLIYYSCSRWHLGLRKHPSRPGRTRTRKHPPARAATSKKRPNGAIRAIPKKTGRNLWKRPYRTIFTGNNRRSEPVEPPIVFGLDAGNSEASGMAVLGGNTKLLTLPAEIGAGQLADLQRIRGSAGVKGRLSAEEFVLEVDGTSFFVGRLALEQSVEASSARGDVTRYWSGHMLRLLMVLAGADS